MTVEQDQALVREFPLLYRDRGRSAQESGMYFGFQVGPGWFIVIRELSQTLENEIKKLIQKNPKVALEHLPAAAQVKEKFGMLRFYMTTYTPEMEKAIEKAETKSETTCEECGSVEGKMNAGPWLMVRCKEHWTGSPSYDETKQYQQSDDNAVEQQP